MERMEFRAGDEGRFFSFISRLNEKDRIAIVSHTDLDGVASAKVANEVISANVLKFVDYIDVNEELVKDLKSRGINKIVLTDIDFDKPDLIKSMEKFAEILIIDHHLFRNDLNSEKTTFLSAEGYCTTYICYYLFYKVQNISNLDWLVAAASISDLCYHKNFEWVMDVKKKYGDTFDIEEMSKRSRIYDLATKLALTLVYFRGKINEAYKLIGNSVHDIGVLDNYVRDVQKEIERSLARFDKEKRIFANGEVYFWEFAPEFFIKSLLIHELSLRHKDKTIIIVENNGRCYEVSVRRQDGKVNLVELLKKLTFEMNATSGGHFKAAGATILPENIAEFRRRVANL